MGIKQLESQAAPLAHTIEGAAPVANGGRTTIYAEIKSGNLKVRKLGRRSLVLDEDLRAWLAALPTSVTEAA